MASLCSRIACLACLLAAPLLPAGCTPGPTDPDGPIVRLGEPGEVVTPGTLRDRGQTGSRKISPVRSAQHTQPHCWDCEQTGHCYRDDTENVCFAQCSETGKRIWDLGLLADGQCDPVAYDFCEANNLGKLTTFCWGGYMAAT